MPIVEGDLEQIKRQCNFIFDGSKGTFRCKEEPLNGHNYCHRHIKKDVINNGTYSAFAEALPDGLEAQYQAFIKDEDVLDLRPLLGMLKTFLFGLIEELEESENKEDIILDMAFIKKVKAISSEIRQCAKTVTDIEINKQAVIDIHQARKFVSDLQKVVAQEVTDPKQKRKIFSGLNNTKFGNKKQEIQLGRRDI
tara:strand:- start:31343 stop:31927 length:585 start_codon:yes stop_codon:yes gene_type:complete